MRSPPGVLGEIVARKRADVAEWMAMRDFETGVPRSQLYGRSLREVLARPGARFIFEYKRSSPSKGVLTGQLEPAAVAKAYLGVADAMSVLTEGPHFGGSFSDLRAARRIFDGPILCKDFIVDPRQIAEARHHGADAILLMLSVLDDDEARSCLAACERWNMEALVEAHTAEELGRAVRLGAPIIGINNRDLTTLGVDLETTERLAERVPTDRILVTESGINDRSDVTRLGGHVDAFLVGSAIMQSNDPGLSARALVFGPVKVCGMTRFEDVREAARLGATHFGMIFVNDSPRRVGVNGQYEDDLVEEAFRGPHFIRPVGVFRREGSRGIASTAKRNGFVAVQIYDAPASTLTLKLRQALPDGCETWGVAPVDASSVGEPPIGADRTVFDTSRGGSSGGTGQTFDWSLLAGRPDLNRSILAGGLNPANARAAQAVGGWALDVNSGVEDAPGIKSPAKLAAFFEALRPLSRKEAQS